MERSDGVKLWEDCFFYSSGHKIRPINDLLQPHVCIHLVVSNGCPSPLLSCFGYLMSSVLLMC